MFKNKKQQIKKDIRYALIPDYTFAPHGASLDAIDINRQVIFRVAEIEFITESPNYLEDKSIIIINDEKREIPTRLIYISKEKAENDCKNMNRGTIHSIGERLINVESKLNNLLTILKQIK